MQTNHFSVTISITAEVCKDESTLATNSFFSLSQIELGKDDKERRCTLVVIVYLHRVFWNHIYKYTSTHLPALKNIMTSPYADLSVPKSIEIKIEKNKLKLPLVTLLA